MTIVDTVIEANARRKEAMVERIVAAAGGSLAGKTIAILGLTFKPNTDDMREAPSLVIVPGLQESGREDPRLRSRRHGGGGKIPGRRRLCGQCLDCIKGADIAVILTEWDQFRALDLQRMAEHLKDKVLVDLRNIYSPEEMAGSGLAYHSIGRGSNKKPAG